jgi:4-hydroxy-tetrahydrodipicolinate reductase
MRVAVVGCAGRMGQMLVREAVAAGATVAGGTERPDSPVLGRDVGLVAGIDPVGALVTADVASVFAGADVVVDFTTPSASALHADLAAEHGTALVSGTTGLDTVQQARIIAASQTVAVVQAPNYSIGITLLTGLIERVAGALGPDYDIEIVEMHHRHKVDAPSGTALGLGHAAAKGRGVALEDVWQKSRDGYTGPRVPGSIGFATLRGGDVVGDHQVIFAGEGERIEIGHRASSRSVLAKGAVRAALWVAGRPAGLYTMRDVLGL